MAPLVSVVMPCFNAGRMLRPALASVLQQTYPTIEVIVVDNNSTDDSADIARKMLAASHRPFIVTECSAQGSNHARNHGYTFAHGDYIQWMDADDAMNHDKIERQVAALETDATTDIAYGDWSGHRTEPGRPDIVQHFALWQLDDQVERALAGVWYPPHLYLPRREAADRLRNSQAWWPERHVGTDVEYSAFAALLGLRFLHVVGAYVDHNAWSNTQTSNATPYAQRVASLQAISSGCDASLHQAALLLQSPLATSCCCTRIGPHAACHRTRRFSSNRRERTSLCNGVTVIGSNCVRTKRTLPVSCYHRH